MPLVQTRGAASAQGFGEFAQAATVANYIEEVFSTFLYTGTGAALTITNNIDLSTKGGLVWIKDRTNAGNFHVLTDTVRGTNSQLRSNATDAADTEANRLTAFSSSGFSIGASSYVNTSAANIVSWTFRKQPKFFDIQTWTGSGANRTISHSLGSVPACIIVKRTDTTAAWAVYHRSLANTQYLVLNTTAAAATGATWWNSTTPTSSVFSLGTDATVNASAGTYVAYIFAHDAGGFGLTGTDNVISCGSFTTNGSGVATVNLGYEPQFVLFKRTDSAGHSWEIIDTMRGFSINSDGTTGNVKRLSANSSGAETTSSAFEMYLTSTGFATNQYFYNATYIYIAIRRGPMKVPTTGTSVFATTTFTGADAIQTSNFPVDFLIEGQNLAGTIQWYWMDRLRGTDTYLESNSTNAQQAQSGGIFTSNTQVKASDDGNSYKRSYEMFRRAPSFFDEVCYTGTGTAGQTFAHNLGVVPELMIVKQRNTARAWIAYSATLGNNKYLVLNSTAAEGSGTTTWNDTSPTASVFSLGSSAALNQSGGTFVNYLFATCAGVSKVGSYTGTATTKQIDCGFTAGARFVLIKRTDSTGDWYVWDTARGIVSGNDPYLLLNTTDAEVTSTDYIDTYSAGFEISSTAPAAINANGGTYIFLAIA